MSELPKSVKSRLQELAMAQVGGHEVHPRAEVLSAFMEQALGASEREQVLEHMSACAECREVVALALPPQEVSESAAVVAGQRGWFGLPRDFMRWGAVAASAAVVVVAVLAVRNEMVVERTGTPSVITKQAETQAPERAPVTAVTDEAWKDSARANLPVKGEGASGEVAALNDRDASAISRAKEEAKQDLQDRVLLSKATAPTEGEGFARRTGGGVAGGVGSGAGAGMGKASAPAVLSAAAPPAGNQPAPAPAGAVAELKVQPQADAVAQRDEAKTQRTDSLSANASKDEKTKNEVVAEERAAVATAQSMNDAESSASGQNKKMEQGSLSTKVMVMGASLAKMRPASRAVAKVWRIAEGQAHVSSNAGESWSAVSLPAGARALSVASVGSVVFVGGADGLLLRSVDDGRSWARVEGGWKGAVVLIRFTDVKSGELRTSVGESWVTEDGGVSWKVHRWSQER